MRGEGLVPPSLVCRACPWNCESFCLYNIIIEKHHKYSNLFCIYKIMTPLKDRLKPAHLHGRVCLFVLPARISLLRLRIRGK